MRLRYWHRFHRCLNLKRPELFYDKIMWQSLNTDTTKWSELADKWAVRDFVAERCGKEVLTKCFGVWDRAEDVDWDALPDSFVVKTTNGCASNVIVRDKSAVDLHDVERRLAAWLRFPYGEVTGQKHYTRITPRVIAEELLFQRDDPQAPLTDYKFYCFDGKPVYCMVMSNREFNTHDVDLMMYDMQWQTHPEFFDPGRRLTEVERPQSLEEMKRLVTALSQGFSFVRVDFYEINGKPVFGEMTFMPGTDINLTLQAQRDLGAMIDLNVANSKS